MNEKGDVPGWMIVIGLLIMLFGIGVMIYISVKGGQVALDLFGG